MNFEGYDLLCGAGGTTSGIEQAVHSKRKIANVRACINHDPVAIESHEANFKGITHFTEDIKNFDVTKFPSLTPGTISFLWASLECTNFSNAKGGLPRNADSRTLGNHLFRYIEHLDTDYIFIENVREFRYWGDLDNQGKPKSKDKGRLFQRWKNKVMSYGYRCEERILDAADYGEHTSRKRLFMIFAKTGMPIKFPAPTHSRYGDMFGMKKWKPVKDCLDFAHEGKSVFQRKKALSDKTIRRIYEGCLKFIAKGDDSFILKYNSAKNSQSVNKGNSIHKPLATITTQGRMQLVCPQFIIKYYKQGQNIVDLNDVAPTLTTKDRLAFIDPQYGKSKAKSVDNPSGALVKNPKERLIVAEYFIDLQYSSGKRNESIDKPNGSLVTIPKESLVKVEKGFILDQSFNNVGQSIEEPCKTLLAFRKHKYLLNPQFKSKGSSVEEPSPTLIARMDKKPISLVSADEGCGTIIIYEDDSETMKKLKMFMAHYGVVDIKMRMLSIKELKKIQGFNKSYILKGTQTNQKKFIGNSVCPKIPKKMIEALYVANLQKLKKAA